VKACYVILRSVNGGISFHVVGFHFTSPRGILSFKQWIATYKT